MPGYASDLVTQACQIAKCPGFVSQAQFQLNRILETLAQDYDLPSAAYTWTNFSISPNGGNGTGTTSSAATQWYLLTMPTSTNPILSTASYLRTKEVFYSVNGSIFYLNQIPTEDYDRFFQGSGISNYPYSYCVDATGSPTLATIQMSFYPPPNTNLSLTIRNQYQPNDIAVASFASTVPWFPNQDILIKWLAMKMMDYTGDQRKQTFYNELFGVPGMQEGMLSKYLKMVGDKENYAMTVKLDPRRFQNPNRLPATKQTTF